MYERLLRLLRDCVAHEEPLRVGLVGAGTFGQMLLAQARRLPGLYVVAVSDLEVAR